MSVQKQPCTVTNVASGVIPAQKWDGVQAAKGSRHRIRMLVLAMLVVPTLVEVMQVGVAQSIQYSAASSLRDT